MPTQQSPHAQPRKRNRSALKWVLGIVGVIVLLIIALPFLLGSLASPALQKTTDNTSRENDISKIAAALITYISNNQNVLPASTAADATPGTLDICGSDCSVTQKQPVTLGYYAATPAAVSFRAYANNLAVPDAKTVYIVTNATCKDDKSGIGDSSADNQSLVILYAIQSGNGIKQQCLNPY